jgi:transposase
VTDALPNAQLGLRLVVFTAKNLYNNHAEQQMRKPVLTRKVSQQNRSELGAKTQAILMTLLRSAELQGANPVETLLDNVKHIIGNTTPLEVFYRIAV